VAAAEAEDVVIEAVDLRHATQFVRRFDLMLRAPDALHAAVCQRLGPTLVTFDQRLARAAAALGIPVLNPADPGPA
jgi:predicted nucleic acid-binding protein